VGAAGSLAACISVVMHCLLRMAASIDAARVLGHATCTPDMRHPNRQECC
jgi:hypothetical protein